MTIPVWQCDSCKKEFRKGGGVAGLAFHVGNESDPVDGHNIREYKHADLCAQCQADLLAELLDARQTQDRASIAKEWGAT